MLASSTVRYFHGTPASLAVGDTLVPGNDLGKGTYGTGHRSAHVYATSGATAEEQQYAIAEAEQWGSDAADSFCDGSTCGAVFDDEIPEPHADACRDGLAYPCVVVYEIAPVDPATVEPDDSSDVEHGGTRMSAARVVRVVTGVLA